MAARRIYSGNTKEDILSTPIEELYNVDDQRKDEIFETLCGKSFSDFNWLHDAHEASVTILKGLWHIGDESTVVNRCFKKKKKKNKYGKKMGSLSVFFDRALSIVTDSDLLLRECVQDDTSANKALDLVKAVNEMISEISFSITSDIRLNMMTVIDFIRGVSNSTLVESFSPDTYVTLAVECGADVNMGYFTIFTSLNPLSECWHIADREDRESTVETLLMHGADMFQNGKAHSLNQNHFPSVIHHFSALETADAISVLKLFQQFYPQPEKFLAKKLPNGSTLAQNFLRCVRCKNSSTKASSHVRRAIRQKLEYFVSEEVNLNRSGDWDEPPIILAANGFDWRITDDILSLCDIKTSITSKSRRGWFDRSVLHVSSNVIMIRKLCGKYGADVDAIDIFGRTPLMYAVLSLDCHCERPSKCKAVADLKKCCNCADTCVDRVRVLIDQGADPTLADEDGVTAFHLSSAVDSKLLEIFLRNCRLEDMTNILDNTGSSPMHYAVFANNIHCTKKLLDFGLDCNIKDNNGRTPLGIAMLYGFKEIAKLLRCEMQQHKKPRLCADIFQVKSSVRAKVVHNLDGYTRKMRVLEKLIALNQSMTEADYDSILNSPFLGCKHLEEAKHVSSEVKSLVAKLSKNIAVSRPEFAFTVKLRGSSKEATKVGFPDEFDFNLIMKNIDDPNEMIYSPATDFPEIDFSVANDSLFGDNDATNPSFTRAFIVAILKVLNCRDFWTNYHLKMGGLRMGKVGPLLTLYWNGAIYKHMKVSVDLIPSFPVKYHPFIPLKFPIPVDFSGCQLHQTLDREGEMEVSYSEVEAVLLKLLPKSAIEGYKLAKAIRSVYVSRIITSSGFTCESITDSIPSYLLKNLLILEFIDVVAAKTDILSIERGEWVERIYRRLLTGGKMLTVCGKEVLSDRF